MHIVHLVNFNADYLILMHLVNLMHFDRGHCCGQAGLAQPHKQFTHFTNQHRPRYPLLPLSKHLQGPPSQSPPVARASTLAAPRTDGTTPWIYLNPTCPLAKQLPLVAAR